MDTVNEIVNFIMSLLCFVLFFSTCEPVWSMLWSLLAFLSCFALSFIALVANTSIGAGFPLVSNRTFFQAVSLYIFPGLLFQFLFALSVSELAPNFFWLPTIAGLILVHFLISIFFWRLPGDRYLLSREIFRQVNPEPRGGSIAIFLQQFSYLNSPVALPSSPDVSDGVEVTFANWRLSWSLSREALPSFLVNGVLTSTPSYISEWRDRMLSTSEYESESVVARRVFAVREAFHIPFGTELRARRFRNGGLFSYDTLVWRFDNHGRVYPVSMMMYPSIFHDSLDCDAWSLDRVSVPNHLLSIPVVGPPLRRYSPSIPLIQEGIAIAECPPQALFTDEERWNFHYTVLPDPPLYDSEFRSLSPYARDRLRALALEIPLPQHASLPACWGSPSYSPLRRASSEPHFFGSRFRARTPAALENPYLISMASEPTLVMDRIGVTMTFLPSGREFSLPPCYFFPQTTHDVRRPYFRRNYRL